MPLFNCVRYANLICHTTEWCEVKKLHRPGIEPGPPAWQASILPLNHRCWWVWHIGHEMSADLYVQHYAVACETTVCHFWTHWACGAMDNAPDYGSGDSRFESWHARNFLDVCMVIAKRFGNAGHRSQYLSHAKRALYHLSYIPWDSLLILKPIPRI